MSTTPHSEQIKPADSNRREALIALIGVHVVRSLGKPENMRKVQVYPIGQDGYRVNVVVGTSASTSRIADSFFLTVDDEGNILTSSPKIVRLY
jgi:hypothetical protein